MHYPLPLLYEENPEPEALKRTIRRLRNELEDVKSTLQKKLEHSRREFADEEESIRTTDSESVELQKMREENSRLTEKVQPNSVSSLRSRWAIVIFFAFSNVGLGSLTGGE